MADIVFGETIPGADKLRILLVAIGSMGDVQPMAVLGSELKCRGHEVGLIAFEALRPMVEAAGLTYYPLPGDAERYIGAIIRPEANPVTYLSRMKEALLDVIEPLFSAILEAAREKDAIVTTFFGSTLYSIAEKLGTPLFEVSYCLTDETGEYCLPVIRQYPLGKAYNRATYRIAFWMIAAVEKHHTRDWCQKNGLRQRSIARGPDYRIGDWEVPVLYAMSEAVVPRPPEWGRNIHQTGFWKDDEEGFDPPEGLERFLAAGEPPVYVGFGSMTSGDSEEAFAAVIQALRANGLRGVLSTGWSGGVPADASASLYVLDSFVEHRKLFERMRAVVHHGGAGTTAAGLMAGRPTLVVPFGGDQFFWGDRVAALGCGPKPLPRTKLTGRRLSASLRALVSEPQYAVRAGEIAGKLARECGQRNAADIIEASLGYRGRVE